MPQAVEAYLEGKNFSEIDRVKRQIISLYENLTAQMIAASGRELYYYTWEKEGSTHYYEVDSKNTQRM
ncbi:MAG: hypothetical protein ACI39N_05685 [Lachnospiraceae bacterium]